MSSPRRTIPTPDSYLGRYEALQREIRRVRRALRQEPRSLVLRTQLGSLQRRAHWYERRTSAEVRSKSLRRQDTGHGRRPASQAADYPL